MLNGNTQELSIFTFDFENEDPTNPLFLHNDSYLIFKFEDPSSKIVGGPVGGEIEGCTTCGSEGSTQGYGKIGTWKITDHYESPMFWAEIENSYTGHGS